MSCRISATDGRQSFNDFKDLHYIHMLHTECGQPTAHHVPWDVSITCSRQSAKGKENELTFMIRVFFILYSNGICDVSIAH
jgi:hypothetical protein